MPELELVLYVTYLSVTYLLTARGNADAVYAAEVGRFRPGNRNDAAIRDVNDAEVTGETNGHAIASLFLSIIWLFGIGSIVAIVLAFRALREIRESNGEQGGRVLALAGIGIGIAGLGSTALMLYFGIYAAENGAS
jgi:hypothetical protein